MKRSELQSCVVNVAAGCSRNGSRDAKASASIEVVANGEFQVVQFYDSLAARTNQQADYLGVEIAADYLVALYGKTGRFPAVIRTKNNNLVLQLQNQRSAKSPQLAAILERIRAKLAGLEITVAHYA